MNNTSFQPFTQVLAYIIKYFKGIIIFAIVLIVASGVYVVESHEVAIVLRFGRLVGNTPQEQIREPGLHFAFPFFIDEIIRVPVHTIQEQVITTHYSSGLISPLVERSGYLLTGDNNVVLIRVIVRYQITDPAQYILFNNDVSTMVDGVVSGELTRLVTSIEMDDILTVGRNDLTNNLTLNVQELMNIFGMGITITSIELANILPPDEVAAYFEAVRSAAVTSETIIQQATEEAQAEIFNAQAIASAARQYAIAVQNMRLVAVNNEMAEFSGLLNQYTINPEMIRSGVFRQRLAAIIANAGSTIIVPDGEETPLIVLP